MDMIALIIAVVLFIAGIVGTVLPVLPGVILIYAGMLAYGFMTGFATLNAYFFILQALVVILLFFVDYFASAIGTKRFGGSKQAAWGAVIGTILGLIVLGPLGIILGPFLGAIAAELIRGTELKKTIQIGLGTLLGVLGGTAVKIGAEIIMIVYFFVRIY
ncbi:hypothetical protein UNSWDHB_2845 [Dehalobacter sp. UNSWDHB]|jgi:Uncharacterized protein conserved in bacteria|uniref:DUF456 domain-containing protein n=1 Tax=unclassified Dehalobacter TaxID=2635733 RepID=UPI00028BA046|nr:MULTISPECIES: DUF456 domain-containing protein [unclassified Dehalobacter]AFV01749.1 protein of unknown function DUF456 [Dehalobacter sp. DCA]AFV04787.1 protein of unknown function DUF456 [Dehalobacter sp. CF]EQB19830.1 hypothetical protein UNSWDHB_2845 [Dehalobacter sp. UNSWDHB]